MNVVADINFSSMFPNRWIIHRESKNIKMMPHDMNARELVAWNTRQLRVVREISLEALARDAGVDRAYVSRIERAVANPTVDVLERIARVLGVEMAELFAVPGPHEERPKPLGSGRRRSTR
jgi:ribosome-binding protein aMBF1 (putative translation factor)